MSCKLAIWLLYSRRLHGRRGLKCGIAGQARSMAESPPSRAAWIEILREARDEINLARVAAFTGGVD